MSQIFRYNLGRRVLDVYLGIGSKGLRNICDETMEKLDVLPRSALENTRDTGDLCQVHHHNIAQCFEDADRKARVFSCRLVESRFAIEG